MEQRSTMGKSAIIPRKSGEKMVSKVFGMLRKFIFQFFLPLVAFGPAVFGAEKLAELMGFHGTSIQFLRMLMIGVYAVVIFTVLRSGKQKK